MLWMTKKETTLDQNQQLGLIYINQKVVPQTYQSGMKARMEVIDQNP